MRIFLAILLAFGAVSAKAADMITATLSLTAFGTNGQTLVVNGDTRTWTNAIYTPATQMYVQTNIPNARGEILHQAGDNPFTGLTMRQTSTNKVIWQSAPGSVVTVTAANWGTVAYSTQAVTSAYVLRVPFNVETATQRTNFASAIAAELNSGYNTNPISAGGNGATNLWAGPTNTFNLLSPSVYSALGDVAVTNLGRTDPAYTRSGSLFIDNTSGSNVTAYLDPWIVTTTGTNYVSCYSNNLTEIAFLSFGHTFTNANVFRYGAIPPSAYSEGYGTPMAYYSMEDINSAGLVDSVNGLNFSHYSGTNSPASGVIANGINQRWGVNRRALDTALDLSTNAFAVRFWFKSANTNNVGDTAIDFGNWAIGYGAFAGASAMEARFYKETSGSWTFASTVVPDTSWHRVWLWYSPSNYTAIRLDQEAITTNTINMRIYADGGADNRDIPGAGASYINYIDELSIWTNYVPTAQDMLYDWNAGAGRGKP